MRIYLLFLLLFTCVAPPIYAASAIPQPTTEAPSSQQLSKKEKRKAQRWEKRKAKWAAKTKKKERKSKFGRLGLLVLLGGVISLVFTDFLFGLALLGALVLGGIGLLKDEKKTAAIISIALPVAFMTLVVIELTQIFGG